MRQLLKFPSLQVLRSAAAKLKWIEPIAGAISLRAQGGTPSLYLSHSLNIYLATVGGISHKLCHRIRTMPTNKGNREQQQNNNTKQKIASWAINELALVFLRHRRNTSTNGAHQRARLTAATTTTTTTTIQGYNNSLVPVGDSPTKRPMRNHQRAMHITMRPCVFVLYWPASGRHLFSSLESWRLLGLGKKARALASSSSSSNLLGHSCSCLVGLFSFLIEDG